MFAHHTTTALTVTSPVVTVKVMCVTVRLVTALMDVTHTGMEQDVTVSKH